MDVSVSIVVDPSLDDAVGGHGLPWYAVGAAVETRSETFHG